jgi:hypothetical protein
MALIDPEEIEPLHGVRNHALFDDLTASMKENGWKGRRLLVIDRESEYLAWTGSHRIAAAREAGLAVVPCYALDEQELLKRGFDCDQPIMDYQRLEILKKIGDKDAIHLMWQEGRC